MAIPFFAIHFARCRRRFAQFWAARGRRSLDFFIRESQMKSNRQVLRRGAKVIAAHLVTSNVSVPNKTPPISISTLV